MRFNYKIKRYNDFNQQDYNDFRNMKPVAQGIFDLYSSSEWCDLVSKIDKKEYIFFLVYDYDILISAMPIIFNNNAVRNSDHYNIKYILEGRNLLFDKIITQKALGDSNIYNSNITCCYYAASNFDIKINDSKMNQNLIVKMTIDLFIDYCLKKKLNVAFIHVSEKNKLLNNILIEKGFIRLVDGPVYYMDIDSPSYLEKLQTMKYKTRKNIRREIKLFNNSNILFNITKEKNIIYEHIELVKDNALKYGWHDFDSHYFKKRLEYLMNTLEYEFFYLSDDEKIIGSTFGIKYKNILYLDSTGICNELCYKKYGLYYQLNYYNIYNYCINNNISRVNYAEKSAINKLSRGCKIDMLYNYVFNVNNIKIEDIYLQEMNKILEMEVKYND